jgi:branched-subunit amino acid transport protein AzlD
MENKARIISSLVLCIAYIITLYYDDVIGARLYAIGNILALPYMIKHRCWDVVFLLSFFLITGLPKALGM